MFICSQIYFVSDLPKVTKLKKVQTLILSKLRKLEVAKTSGTAVSVSSDCWCGEWLLFAPDTKYYPLMYVQVYYTQLIL